MKYRVKIDGTTMEEDPPRRYSDWEGIYYKTIMLHNTYSVNPESKIEITVWISKNFGASTSINTYYGTDGYSYSSVENEEMGAFTIENSGDSGNGTSSSSGQIPAILYYSE